MIGRPRRPPVLAALWAKDLHQHALVLVGVTAMLAVAWLSTVLSFGREARALSPLDMLARFSGLPLVTAVFYLGQRLVVAEHYGRSQRFLEALPVRRAHVALAKASLGLTIALLWAAALLAASLHATAATSAVDARFAGVVALRLAVYTFALWATVFLFGTFGRVRLFLLLAVVVVLLVLDRTTDVQVFDVGPFALMNQSRLLERAAVPWSALGVSALWGTGAFALAFLLLAVRDGSLAEALARPLSSREVAALVVMALGAVYVLVEVDRQRQPEPYKPRTEQLWRDPGGSAVRIAYFDEERRAPAERLGPALSAGVRALGDALGFAGAAFPVTLVHGPEVRFPLAREVQLDGRQGAILRVNLPVVAEGPLPDIVADVLHGVLVARSRDRADRERLHALLDGFVLHFARAPHGAATWPPPEADPWLLRALSAHQRAGADPTDLARYHPLVERLGHQGAMAFAASGVRFLEAQVGRDRVLALARAALGRAGTNDIRDFVHERRHPLPALFAAHTGLDWVAFLDRWRGELRRLGALPAVAAALAVEPRAQVTLRAADPDEAPHLEVVWQPAAADRRICRLLERRLEFGDGAVPEESLLQTQFFAGPGDRTTVDLSDNDAGQWALVALDCESPVFAGPVRLFARRVTLP